MAADSVEDRFWRLVRANWTVAERYRLGLAAAGIAAGPLSARLRGLGYGA